MARKKYYQRPDGLYETSRTINGKRVKFRGKTCAEVDRKILEYDMNRKQGRPFDVVAEEWLEEKEQEVSVGTMRLYRCNVSSALEYFGKVRLGDLTPLDIKRYVKCLERQGYERNTIDVKFSTVKQILKHAVLEGDIAVSPAAEVGSSKKPKNVRPALTEEQERKVEACREGDWWLMGLMFLYTGCRWGELMALEWQDIDREAKVIHITKKISSAHGSSLAVLEHHLKSKNSKRDIPLLPILEEVLPRNRIGRIFTIDGEYISSTKFITVWKDYCKAAGLTAMVGGRLRATVTPHQFRHSFATICYEAGIDSMSAAAMLGDTEEVTRGIYTELRAKHHASSAEKVNAFLLLRKLENERQKQA